MPFQPGFLPRSSRWGWHRWTVAVLSLWSAACGTNSSPGGYVAAFAAGSPCTTEGAVVCGVVVSGYAALRCTAGAWQVDAACAPGQLCGYIGPTPACQAATRGTVGDVQGAIDGLVVGDADGDLPTPPDGASVPDQTADAAVDQTEPPPDAQADAGPIIDTGPPTDANADIKPADTAVSTAECGVSADCPDSDPCTIDQCMSGKCVHTPAPPGASCATSKVCTAAGECACVNPKKTGVNCTECIDPAATGPNCVVEGGCQLPNAWSGAVQAVSSLTVAPAATGCDLDGDGKPNNAISKGLSSFLKSFSDAMNKAVTDGTASWLLHTPGWNTVGNAFTLSVMTGKLSSAGCDTQSATAKCSYLIDKAAYNVSSSAMTCPTAISYPDAYVQNQTLNAGGLTQVVPITLNMQGVAMSVTARQATVSAVVSSGGSSVTSTEGLNCGIILKSDVLLAIDAIPEAQLQQLGMDAMSLNALISSMLVPDIDFDGDGTKDSYSFAYQWKAVPAKIVGYVAQ